MPPSATHPPRRGILLAGGANTRLFPCTRAVAKSLLPVYDKPLIYYSLALVMQAGVREVLVITTPQAQDTHRQQLGDGSAYGITIEYAVQTTPLGIADALVIGRDFIANRPCMLVLSDNIFDGDAMPPLLQAAAAEAHGATVFAQEVPDPQRFGVVAFDAQGNATSLEEKPAQPKSSYAVTGCYFYDAEASARAAALSPSARGEYEITDLNRTYLESNALRVQQMDASIAWFDTGTPESLATAADYVRRTQAQQQRLIASPEEIAWRQGWLDDAALQAAADAHKNTAYGSYLQQLLAG